jgi:hypothetical protein
MVVDERLALAEVVRVELGQREVGVAVQRLGSSKISDFSIQLTDQ